MSLRKGHRTLKIALVGVLSVAVLIEAFVLVGGISFLKQHGGLASVLPSVVALLTNDARTEEHLASLTDNELLRQGAQMKADDMAEKGYFSHTGPDGSQPWKWFSLAGYRYQFAGENLAVNFTESEDVVAAWLKSPSHRANILKKDFTEIGIGIATGTYKGKEAVFVVQFFGKPAPQGLAQVGGADGSRVAADAFLHSEQVLGTSTSLVGQFLTSPDSPQKQAFYVLLGVFLILLVVGFVFGKRFPKLWPTIAILLALAILLGFALYHKEHLLGQPYIESQAS
ncbi:MAG TPA: CAP domain-containing protein [Candidatus Paceibacterota bacterium]|nr:CAP domain-containing protein [Candidatus Paceibacterota bacterium]